MPELPAEWSYQQSIRVKEGLKKALANGKKLGRPKIIRDSEISEKVFILKNNGWKYRDIALMLKISKSSLQRIYQRYCDFIIYKHSRELEKTKELIFKLKKMEDKK